MQRRASGDKEANMSVLPALNCAPLIKKKQYGQYTDSHVQRIFRNRAVVAGDGHYISFLACGRQKSAFISVSGEKTGGLSWQRGCQNISERLWILRGNASEGSAQAFRMSPPL